MTKSKSHKEDEDLRGLVRELKKENARLRRQLEKTVEVERVEQVEDVEVKLRCPACASGALVETDLGSRLLTTCSKCSWRRVRYNDE